MKAKRSVAAKRFLVLFGASAKKNSPRKAVPFRGIFLVSCHLFRFICCRFLAFYGDIQFPGYHLDNFHSVGQYV